MGRWEIVERYSLNDKKDIVTVHIHYRGGSIAVREHWVYKDEPSRCPRHLLMERKWGETTKLNGNRWVEGKVKGKNLKPRHSKSKELNQK